MKRLRTNDKVFALARALGASISKNGLGVPDGHRGWRKSNTLLKKVLLAIRWLSVMSVSSPRRRVALSALGIHKSEDLPKKFALIIGGGLSSDKSLQKQLLALSEKLNSSTFVMNYFHESPLFGKLKPDYWVMLDLQAQESFQNERTACAWQAIKESESRVVVPWQFFESTSHNSKLAIDNDSLAGISRNVSPLWPRGYEGKSCLKAMCLASFLGFETIYIFGCDNDYFREVTVRDGFALGQDISYLGSQPVEDYFQNISNEFAYEKMVLDALKSNVVRLDSKLINDLLHEHLNTTD